MVIIRATITLFADAAADAGSVAGDGAARDCQGASVGYASSAKVLGDDSISNRQPGDRDVEGAAGDVEDAKLRYAASSAAPHG